MPEVEWIAADWGTTNLRIWALDRNNSIVAKKSSHDGMATLKPDQFESALLNLVSDLLPKNKQTLVVASGMVGAKQGWKEAPYLSVPCVPAKTSTQVPTSDTRLDVRILPGVSQSVEADVMRGEETQVKGFLYDKPNWSGQLCIPGTHSKWVCVEDGEISSFLTFMTGEMFDVFKQHTVLKHSVSDEGWDQDEFDKAVLEVLKNPESFVARLFGIRASGLLHNFSKSQSSSRLSGLLIGAEVNAAKPFWEKASSTHILASPKLGEQYERALNLAGADVQFSDVEPYTLAGLIAAANSLGYSKPCPEKAPA